MDNSSIKQYDGIIVDDAANVSDADSIHELYGGGYGQLTEGKLTLATYETLYLLYYKNLNLKRKRHTVTFDEFMRQMRKKSNDTLVRFLIYRDLRTRGYVVRDGFGFGSDFCVYERGDYGKKGTKYLVFGFSDGKYETAGALQKKVIEITSMGKEPIVAVVDGRGEVIYYKITSATFAGNKLDT